MKLTYTFLAINTIALQNDKTKALLKKSQQQKELFLSLTPEAKQIRILNPFYQIWNKNLNFYFIPLFSKKLAVIIDEMI